MRIAVALAALALAGGAGIAAAQDAPPSAWTPPLGANTVFESEPGAAPGHRLIVTDLRLAPDAVGETHAHPWEEYLYIIEGSAVLTIAGSPPRTLVAGEKVVIPARAVHTPQAGPQGVRGIVTRVHDLADPLRLIDRDQGASSSYDPMG